MKEDGEPMFTLIAQDRHGVAIVGGLQEHQKVRTDGICPTLTQAMGMGGGQTPCILGTRIRKLTPRECWRLQGFPDEKFDKAVAAGVSNSQLYKQAGNAVTVNVAEAIGKRLREIELSEN
jgi:DNA (cytosine-5)-methyltransferase 1